MQAGNLHARSVASVAALNRAGLLLCFATREVDREVDTELYFQFSSKFGLILWMMVPEAADCNHSETNTLHTLL